MTFTSSVSWEYTAERRSIFVSTQSQFFVNVFAVQWKWLSGFGWFWTFVVRYFGLFQNRDAAAGNNWIVFTDLKLSTARRHSHAQLHCTFHKNTCTTSHPLLVWFIYFGNKRVSNKSVILLRCYYWQWNRPEYIESLPTICWISIYTTRQRGSGTNIVFRCCLGTAIVGMFSNPKFRDWGFSATFSIPKSQDWEPPRETCVGPTSIFFTLFHCRSV